MTDSGNIQNVVAITGSTDSAGMDKPFPLLRRLSVSSLVAMLVTAFVMIWFYRADQVSEHVTINESESVIAIAHLAKHFGDQFHSLIISASGFDNQELKANPKVDSLLPIVEKLNDGRWIKLRLYDQAGRIVFSSVKEEIAQAGRHPELVRKALGGEEVYQTEFRQEFLAESGEMKNIHVSLTYMPLLYAGRPFGVIEIYSNLSPIFNRIRNETIKIGLLVLAAFSMLYLMLFFAVRKADRDVAAWQKKVSMYDHRIQDMAFYDALTQLPNRYLLEDRLVQSMEASKRSGLYCSLMFLDFDNFKPLNDQYGHEVGDLLLAEGARRINGCVRGVDTVARFGGDEFVVILNELDKDKAAAEFQAGVVAEKIRVALAAPYKLTIPGANGESIMIEHRCTSSIGVAVYLDHQETSSEILRRADAAMYQAKETGRNVVQYYQKQFPPVQPVLSWDI